MASATPIQSLRQLTEGSFEHLTARLNEAVAAKVAKVLGEGVGYRVVATFPTNVVVVGANGKAARFAFVENDGVLRITGHELLGEAVTEESSGLRAEVEETLRSLMKGELGADKKLAQRVAQLN